MPVNRREYHITEVLLKTYKIVYLESWMMLTVKTCGHSDCYVWTVRECQVPSHFSQTQTL